MILASAAKAGRLTRASLTTPLGDMLAMASPDGLCALEFAARRPRLTRLQARLRRYFPAHEIADGQTPVIDRTRAWLQAYFDGVSAELGDLPLDMRGAPFERRVWTALLRIPPGSTTSYGEIARQLGSPGAPRAVGAANGANPIAIVVPCHRVIGASGSLTGYGGGLERKMWLIDHERRWRRDSLF
jgi:methylated-DNA-[protein]-cysteine S-methyltransferase